MTATNDAARMRTRAKEARRRRVQQATAGVKASDVLAGVPGLGVIVKRDKRGDVVLSCRLIREPITDLLSLRLVRQLVEDLELGSVVQARLDGESWDEIAGYLEMSRQGAQKKFARADELAAQALRGNE